MSTVEISRDDVIRKLENTIARDPNAVAALYATDAVRYDPTAPQGMKGRDAIRKYQEILAKAFNDVEARTLSVVSRDDMVAWQWDFSLTNTGPIDMPTGTMAPTNRRVRLQGASFYRFNREGLITEQRDYWDNASFAQQLGVKL
jgi:steroid delta-isomerase-like uncharacterized protein